MISSKIRNAVRCRGITSLYHFTPLANIESILVNGLVSRHILDQSRALYIYTDDWRNDGQLDAVSLSFHDINLSMFSTKQRGSRCAWAILEIDASVLWTHPCRFCWVNAASSEIVNHYGFIGGPWAFEKMFADCPVSGVDPRSFRAVYNRSIKLPTMNDAEVQILAPITPDLIRMIMVASVSDQAVAEEAMKAAGKGFPIAVVPDLFA